MYLAKYTGHKIVMFYYFIMPDLMWTGAKVLLKHFLMQLCVQKTFRSQEHQD